MSEGVGEGVDPVLGSVAVAFIGLIGAIVTAVITARGSAERLEAQYKIRRQQDRIRQLERERGIGEDEESIDDD